MFAHPLAGQWETVHHCCGLITGDRLPVYSRDASMRGSLNR